MIRMTLCLAATLALGACTEEDERPGRGSGQASPDDDAGPSTDDAALPGDDAAAPRRAAAPPGGGTSYIRIQDNAPEGTLQIGNNAGADIDAVRWTCVGSAPTWADPSFGPVIENRRGGGSDFPIDRLYGPPDGPCEVVNDCAANLGIAGDVYVPTGRAGMAGCVVDVFEVADSPSDAFLVYWCSATQPDSCLPMPGAGTDGGMASYQVPARP